MVDHPTQVANILAYYLTTYSNVPGGIANTYSIYLEKPDSGDYTTDEFWRLIVRADTKQHLDDIINTIHKINSKHPDGYQYYTDTVDTDYEDFAVLSDNFRATRYDAKILHENLADQSMGRIGEDITYGYRVFFKLPADFDKTNIVDAKVIIIPNQDYESGGVTINITACTAPAFVDLGATFTNENYTEGLSFSSSTTLLGTTWTADLPIEIVNTGSGANTLIDLVESAHTFFFMDGGAADNTATFTFDNTSLKLVITRTFLNDDYPFNVEVKLLEKYELEAEFRIRFRWGNP
jgi:hypothetical protein